MFLLLSSLWVDASCFSPCDASQNKACNERYSTSTARCRKTPRAPNITTNLRILCIIPYSLPRCVSPPVALDADVSLAYPPCSGSL